MDQHGKGRQQDQRNRVVKRLLTRCEERRLVQHVRRGRRAQAQLDRRGAMTRARRKRLARLVAAGRRAADQIILSNQGLVYTVANRYRSSDLALDDLVQEGFIGLLEATYRFQPWRGTRFSTYATWWIRQAVGRAVDQKGRLIRLPVCQEERRRRIVRAARVLEQQLNRDPTSSELANQVQLPVSEVELVLRASQALLSLDQPYDDQDEGPSLTLRDTIADSETDNLQQIVAKQQHEMISALLQELPPREARILEMRFGLRNGEGLTLDEIGRRFGLTRERVRQLQNLALDRLRDPAYRKRLEAC